MGVLICYGITLRESEDCLPILACYNLTPIPGFQLCCKTLSNFSLLLVLAVQYRVPYCVSEVIQVLLWGIDCILVAVGRLCGPLFNQSSVLLVSLSLNVTSQFIGTCDD